MKNLLLGMAAFLMLSTQLTAQDYSRPTRIFKKGQTDIQFGYSLLTSAVIMDKATTKFPPVSIRGDRFFSDNFSMGISYSVSSHESRPYIVPDGLEQRIINTTHQVTVRPTFHITTLKNTDLYGGMAIGLNFEEFTVDRGNTAFITEHKNFKPQKTKGVYSAFVGGRYVLSKKWSVFGEVGFGTSLMTVGTGYRI